MAEVIRMPKMSDTMTEGVIAAWLKKVGDEVKSGDILAEVETDKATMELEAYDDGTLLHIGVQVQEAALVDGIIAIIGKKGESFDHLLVGEESVAPATDLSAKDAPEENDSPEIDTSSIKATVITMPKMSDTMEEGTIAQWLKKEGDAVKSGDILAEVETDKATMELESYEDGILLYIGPKDGEAVVVDGVLAIIGEANADYKTLLHAQNASVKPIEAVKQTPAQDSVAAPTPVPTTPAINSTQETVVANNGRLRASPLAKKLAKEFGYDIASIKGSGDHGRVVKRDVELHKPGVASTTVSAAKEEAGYVPMPVTTGEESYTEVAVSQMRKTIAKRLAESKFSAPHFYLTMEINMDNAIATRISMNEVSPVKISFNDLVVKATAAALRQHPKVNSSWLGDKIRYNNHIHIGVAVAVEEGLLVPVVKFTDQKSVSQISAEIKDLAAMAVNKQLQPEHWQGNTFTISNLGMFGIEEFTAIINSPDACILAVGGIKQTAVVKDGNLVPGNVMKVTLSCDHRVVDGVIGSAFLKTFRELLEDPVRILV